MKYLGAKVGGVVSVVTIALILYRLVDATAPVATDLVLTSESPSLVSVQSLEIDGKNVLPAGWTPAALAASAAARPAAQASAALPLGRPARIKAMFAVPQHGATSCDLEPRPHGECVVLVRFRSASEMRCEFECASTSAAPKN